MKITKKNLFREIFPLKRSKKEFFRAVFRKKLRRQIFLTNFSSENYKKKKLLWKIFRAKTRGKNFFRQFNVKQYKFQKSTTMANYAILYIHLIQYVSTRYKIGIFRISQTRLADLICSDRSRIDKKKKCKFCIKKTCPSQDEFSAFYFQRHNFQRFSQIVIAQN